MWCVYLTSRELSCAMLCSFTGSFCGLNFHMFSGSTGVGGELLRLPPPGGGLQEGWWGEQWPRMCACPGSRTQSMWFLRHWDVLVLLLFPTCQVRVVRFYQSCSPPPPPPPHPPPPPPPRSPDPSGHSWTSTASARSQWALPDLHREQIPVGTAGPPPRAPDPTGTAGPQPRLPGRSGHCRTSTASSRSQWALSDLNGQIECQKICQIECQIECQKICQIECQKICQIECQKICQKICQNICQKICQIECQKICQIECQKICQ